ncbi:MAG TPA: O-acetyl-ADP-ribose deacetylase [Holophagaceae bacterium]|nr:O-acetyl-ADP-ribose deacetylase [Holophagaceae bacterium]
MASLSVIQADITTLAVDAIVNAANASLMGGGGVDGAIHRAAGPDLLKDCMAIRSAQGGCHTGQAVLTGGHRLRALHVIHTVGPVWQGGNHGEEELLASCYRTSLALATQHQCDSIAFPAISTGIFGFPADRAARIAVRECRAWQETHGRPASILLVAYDPAAVHPLQDALDGNS